MRRETLRVRATWDGLFRPAVLDQVDRIISAARPAAPAGLPAGARGGPPRSVPPARGVPPRSVPPAVRPVPAHPAQAPVPVGSPYVDAYARAPVHAAPPHPQQAHPHPHHQPPHHHAAPHPHQPAPYHHGAPGPAAPYGREPAGPYLAAAPPVYDAAPVSRSTPFVILLVFLLGCLFWFCFW